ncbi:hypothetical protein EV561_101335 [Rhizobium sp. BK376]|jgi:hypothetical protein|nr:hypothetical protein EV561_101335 [Rhizobium sp. BK376]
MLPLHNDGLRLEAGLLQGGGQGDMMGDETWEDWMARLP